MSTTHGKDYLWEGSGDPDPVIAGLEVMLRPQRHEGAALDWARLGQQARMSERSTGEPRAAHPWHPGRMRRVPWAAAAAVGLMALGAWIGRGGGAEGWRMESLAGAPAPESLGVGRWFETDVGSRVRLEVGSHGHVTVEPGSRVRITRSRDDRKSLELARGTIDAFIVAPPRLFLVDTPAGRAVDMGCAYTLEVDDGGVAVLHVTLGHVALEGAGLEAMVPRGATCVTRKGRGPGVPFFTDASAEFLAALARLDAGAGKGRDDDLAAVLIEARERDAMTLWHLLSRVAGNERGRVYERLAALSQAPGGVTREAVMALDREALRMWWEALE